MWNMSVACMRGYTTLEESSSASSSFLPMMVMALFTLDREVTFPTLMSFSQESISSRTSLANLNSTLSLGTPRATKQSSIYLAHA